MNQRLGLMKSISRRARLIVPLTLIAAMVPLVGGLTGSSGAAGTEIISNPGFETESGSAPGSPAAWRHDSWGNNTAAFAWTSSGAHGGTHASRIDVSAYVDGGAKWSFDSQPITAEAQYQYSSWYRSDRSSEILAVYGTATGGTAYQWITDAPAAASWTNYTTTFTTPANVTTITVFQTLTGVGYLETDDFSLTSYTPPPPPPFLGIVPNGALETASAGNPAEPAAWRHDSWGTNSTSFSWTASGAHGGTHAARIDMSSYADGGAKWSFDPQPVSGGSSYRLTNFYRSDRATEVLAVYGTATGGTAYQWLGNVAAAPAWTEYTTTFTAPANVTTLTIFQSITGVGFVEIDDVKINVLNDPPPNYLGIVPNGDVEKVNIFDPTMPAYWRHDSWGNNASTFSWTSSSSHSSSHATRIDVSSYTDGGAKWSFDPQGITPNKTYQYSGWHRSDRTTEVLGVYTTTSGNVSYQLLGNVAASATWTSFTTTFSTPSNAATLTIFQSITGVGFLETDDVSVSLFNPVPFTRPLVTLTFDDGTAPQYTIGRPKLQALGLPASFYIISSYINDAGPPVQMTSAQILSLANTPGFEVGSHTVTHPHLTTMTSAQQDYELQWSKLVLQLTTFKPITTFVSPYGDYNDAVLTKTAANYQAHRTVDDGFNIRGSTSMNRLKSRLILNTTTAADVAQWIAQAQAEGTWLILVFHDIYPNPDTYDVDQPTFNAILDTVKASGVTVKNLADARAEVLPQL